MIKLWILGFLVGTGYAEVGRLDVTYNLGKGNYASFRIPTQHKPLSPTDQSPLLHDFQSQYGQDRVHNVQPVRAEERNNVQHIEHGPNLQHGPHLEHGLQKINGAKLVPFIGPHTFHGSQQAHDLDEIHSQHLAHGTEQAIHNTHLGPLQAHGSQINHGPEQNHDPHQVHGQQLDHEQQLAHGQELNHEQQLAHGHHLAHDQQLAHDQELAYGEQLAHDQQLAHGQQLGHEQQLAHDQQLANDQQLAHGEQLANDQQLALGQQFAHRQQLAHGQQLDLSQPDAHDQHQAHVLHQVNNPQQAPGLQHLQSGVLEQEESIVQDQNIQNLDPHSFNLGHQLLNGVGIFPIQSESDLQRAFNFQLSHGIQVGHGLQSAKELAQPGHNVHDLNHRFQPVHGVHENHGIQSITSQHTSVNTGAVNTLHPADAGVASGKPGLVHPAPFTTPVILHGYTRSTHHIKPFVNLGSAYHHAPQVKPQHDGHILQHGISPVHQEHVQHGHSLEHHVHELGDQVHNLGNLEQHHLQQDLLPVVDSHPHHKPFFQVHHKEHVLSSVDQALSPIHHQVHQEQFPSHQPANHAILGNHLHESRYPDHFTNPVQQAQLPVHQDTHPVHPNQFMIHQGHHAVHPNQIPVHQSHHAVHQAQFSVHQDQHPVHQARFPVAQNQHPVHPNQFPVHQDQHPVHQAQLPVHPNQHPIHQSQFPVHPNQHPVPQSQFPVHKNQHPVHQAQFPVHQDQHTVYNNQHIPHEHPQTVPLGPVLRPSNAYNQGIQLDDLPSYDDIYADPDFQPVHSATTPHPPLTPVTPAYDPFTFGKDKLPEPVEGVDQGFDPGLVGVVENALVPDLEVSLDPSSNLQLGFGPQSSNGPSSSLKNPGPFPSTGPFKDPRPFFPIRQTPESFLEYDYTLDDFPEYDAVPSDLENLVPAFIPVARDQNRRGKKINNAILRREKKRREKNSSRVSSSLKL